MAEPDTTPTPSLGIPAVTDRVLLENLTGLVTSGFKRIEADIALVASDLGVVKGRVKNLEDRQDSADQRTATHSGGVRQLSTNDADQAAAIATIITKVDGLEVKVTALGEELAHNSSMTSTLVADGVSWVKAHPAISLAFSTLVTTVLTSLTAYLASRGH